MSSESVYSILFFISGSMFITHIIQIKMRQRLKMLQTVLTAQLIPNCLNSQNIFANQPRNLRISSE